MFVRTEKLRLGFAGGFLSMLFDSALLTAQTPGRQMFYAVKYPQATIKWVFTLCTAQHLSQNRVIKD